MLLCHPMTAFRILLFFPFFNSYSPLPSRPISSFGNLPHHTAKVHIYPSLHISPYIAPMSHISHISHQCFPPSAEFDVLQPPRAPDVREQAAPPVAHWLARPFACFDADVADERGAPIEAHWWLHEALAHALRQMGFTHLFPGTFPFHKIS